MSSQRKKLKILQNRKMSEDNISEEKTKLVFLSYRIGWDPSRLGVDLELVVLGHDGVGHLTVGFVVAVVIHGVHLDHPFSWKDQKEFSVRTFEA